VTAPSEALVARYRDVAVRLLPPGDGLSKRPESNVARLLEAASVEQARLHERVDGLRSESLPSRSVETLDEWEAALGLPDCAENPTTNGERQVAVVSKLIASGDQSEATFQAIVATIGYTVTFQHRYVPATCEDTCEDYPADISWAFIKEVVGTGTLALLPLLRCRMDAHAHLYGLLLYDSPALLTTPTLDDEVLLVSDADWLAVTADGSPLLTGAVF